MSDLLSDRLVKNSNMLFHVIFVIERLLRYLRTKPSQSQAIVYVQLNSKNLKFQPVRFVILGILKYDLIAESQ